MGITAMDGIPIGPTGTIILATTTQDGLTGPTTAGQVDLAAAEPLAERTEAAPTSCTAAEMAALEAVPGATAMPAISTATRLMAISTAAPADIHSGEPSIRQTVDIDPLAVAGIVPSEAVDTDPLAAVSTIPSVAAVNTIPSVAAAAASHTIPLVAAEASAAAMAAVDSVEAMAAADLAAATVVAAASAAVMAAAVDTAVVEAITTINPVLGL